MHSSRVRTTWLSLIALTIAGLGYVSAQGGGIQGVPPKALSTFKDPVTPLIVRSQPAPPPPGHNGPG